MRRALSAIALSLTACSPAPREIAVAWPSSTEAAKAEAAQWVYTPGKSAPCAKSIPAQGGRLLLCDRGERWFDDGKKPVVASAVAPEPLVDAVFLPDGLTRFRGRSGALYDAASPLGLFSRTIASPPDVHALLLAGSRTMVVTTGNELFVSTDAVAYARKDLGRPIGDAVLDSSGFGVALGFPEQLFVTLDHGETWTEKPSPRVGATGLVWLSPGRAIVSGESSYVVEKDGKLTPADEPRPPAPVQFEAVTPRTVDAANVLASGFVDGDRTFATERLLRGMAFVLKQGKVGETVSETTLLGTGRCEELSLASSKSALYGACTAMARGELTVRVLRWTNTAEPPTELGGTRLQSPFRGSLGFGQRVKITASDSGEVYLGRVCARENKSCTMGVYALTKWVDKDPNEVSDDQRDGGRSKVDEAPLPPWKRVQPPDVQGDVLAWLAEGKNLTVVARRLKSNQLVLFVSQDKGQHFDARDLGVPAPQGRANVVLSRAEDGALVVGIDGAQSTFVQTDKEGRPLSANTVPATTLSARVGLFGRRGLLVDHAHVMETDDGGASWKTVDTNQVLAEVAEHPVVCTRDGCAVGTRLARLGWGTTLVARAETVRPSFPPRKSPTDPREPGLRCKLSREKWQKFPKDTRFPRATDADLGKWAWAVVSEPAQGTARMVHGTRTGALDEVALLPPQKPPATPLVLVIPQAEGGILLRGRVGTGVAAQVRPGQRAVPSPNLVDLEVGFENALTGKIVHAKLPDVQGEAEVFAAAHPSITTNGAYVLFGADETAKLFHIDEKGVVTKPRWPRLAEQRGPLFGDMVWTPDGAFVLQHPGPAGTQTWRWSSPTGSGSLALNVAGAPRSEITIAYADKQTFATTRQMWGEADVAFGFAVLGDRGLGDALPLPTQASYLANPATRRRPCNAEDKRTTPRSAAPRASTPPRKVLVEAADGGKVAELVSQTRILHGTLLAPCEVAFDTEVGTDGASALVLSAELGKAWFFRTTGEVLETRAMQCVEDARVTTDQ